MIQTQAALKSLEKSLDELGKDGVSLGKVNKRLGMLLRKSWRNPRILLEGAWEKVGT